MHVFCVSLKAEIHLLFATFFTCTANFFIYDTQYCRKSYIYFRCICFLELSSVPFTESPRYTHIYFKSPKIPYGNTRITFLQTLLGRRFCVHVSFKMLSLMPTWNWNCSLHVCLCDYLLQHCTAWSCQKGYIAHFRTMYLNFNC